MLSPFPIIVVASQLITIAAADIPIFDISRGCKAEGSSIESVERCTGDEASARNELQTEWSQFDSSSKSTCFKETTISDNPSYVELLTCLEMARDAQKRTPLPSK